MNWWKIPFLLVFNDLCLVEHGSFDFKSYMDFSRRKTVDDTAGCEKTSLILMF